MDYDNIEYLKQFFLRLTEHIEATEKLNINIQDGVSKELLDEAYNVYNHFYEAKIYCKHCGNQNKRVLSSLREFMKNYI